MKGKRIYFETDSVKIPIRFVFHSRFLKLISRSHMQHSLRAALRKVCLVMFGGSFKWKKVDDGQITSRVASLTLGAHQHRGERVFQTALRKRADDEGVKTFEKSQAAL